ncbi:hypothetical protein C8Q79DRAFT_339263 [Trametes meyenii]|nr:hypothetical protein C8Q79DRAFT_339263 [Trametes meyenii]
MRRQTIPPKPVSGRGRGQRAPSSTLFLRFRRHVLEDPHFGLRDRSAYHVRPRWRTADYRYPSGVGPFQLVILKTGSVDPTDVFANIPPGSTSLVWKVNIAAGTSVNLKIEDSTGSLAQSAPFVIQPGEDDCLLF